MKIKKLIQNSIIIFLACFLVCLSIIVFLMSKENHNIYKNWQTKSNLLIIPENTDYDLLIMGGTQALTLSRGVNHANIEKILNKKILNIARYGGKGGIKQEEAYLAYFYERKNRAKKIIYFLTPWILYSLKFNENNLESFDDEPFNTHFFVDLLKTGVNKSIILNYLKSNFKDKKFKIINFQGTNIKSYIYTPEDEESFLANKYHSGTDERLFKKHAEEFINIIKMAKKHNSEIIIVVSANLIKKEHETDQFKSFLEELKNKYNVHYYDFSNAVIYQNMYYDIDHLNTAGAAYYSQNYLKPVINDTYYKTQDRKN